MPETETAIEAQMVPEVVSHTDYLKAIRPLLTLLNVGENEVYTDLHITPSGEGFATINLLVVARDEGDDSPYPTAMKGPRPAQKYAEMVYRTTTRVEYR